MKKPYTPFGRFFSLLRKEREETLEDCSKKMNVSIAYISSVEHGERNIPDYWRDLIIEKYDLNNSQIARLDKSIEQTPKNCRITMKEVRQCMVNFIISLYDDKDEQKRLIEDWDRRMSQLTNKK